MANYISRAFSQLEITITDREVKQMIELVQRFETRGTNVFALNGQLLGVYPIAFKDEDRSAFFDLFGVRESDVLRIIKGIPTIAMNHKVASDPFNNLVMWIIHLGFVQIKDEKVRMEFILHVARYLHYKYFTSLVNYFFPYLANEKHMTATISTLSRKFDIVVYGTWKKLIEARCADLVSSRSIHIKAFIEGGPDDKLLYAITDTQTRIRDRVKNVVNAYYDVRESGLEIKSRSATLEVDGETILIQTTSTLDTMVANVYAEVTNVREFVDPQMVRAVNNQFNAISETALRQLLNNVSALAKEQTASKELDDAIVIRKNGSKTVGVRAIVRDILQSSYRYAIRNQIPLDNKADVYIRIKNVYASSRIADATINGVKDRVEILVNDLTDTSREATKSSLRLAFISYIVFKGLKYL